MAREYAISAKYRIKVSNEVNVVLYLVYYTINNKWLCYDCVHVNTEHGAD